MALNIKTIVKIFMIFLVFQVSINSLVNTLPNLISLDNSEEDYLDFINSQTNANFNAEDEGNSLLDSFKSSIETENLFNDNIIDTFLGVLQVIGEVIRFIIQLALNILFVPSIIMQILLYDFIGISSLLLASTVVVNIFFYMTLFYIIFNRRTTQ